MATTTLITLMDLTQHGTFNAAVISVKCLLAFILLMEVTPHAMRIRKIILDELERKRAGRA